MAVTSIICEKYRQDESLLWSKFNTEGMKFHLSFAEMKEHNKKCKECREFAHALIDEVKRKYPYRPVNVE